MQERPPVDRYESTGALPRAASARRTWEFPAYARWLVVAAAGGALLALPGAGLAPASGGPFAHALLGAARLLLAVPLLVAGLGIAPVRLFGLERGAAAFALGSVAAPLLWAIVGGAVLFAGGGLEGAARAACGLAVALSLVAAWHERSGDRDAKRTAGDRAAWQPALLFAGAVALVFLLNPVLAQRSDGWFHAAVVYRVDLLGLPPDDPYFVGIPLGYFWAFHLSLGVLGAAAGVTPFAAGAALSVVAALAVGLWLAILAREHCGRSAAPAAVLLIVTALNPLGWLVWLGRGLGGETRGAGELVRAWEGGTLGALESISWGYPHPSLAWFPDKFLIVTAFGLGYAAVLAFARTLTVPSRGRAFGIAFSTAAVAFFLHPVSGLAIVAGTLLWILLGAAGIGAPRRPGAVAFGVAGAGVLAAPYLGLALLGRATEPVRWEFSADALWAWALAGSALALLAAPELLRWWRERRRRPERLGLAAWALVLAAGSVLLVFPPRNETKLFLLAAVLLAVPAAGGWSRYLRTRARRLLVVGLALTGIPTLALGAAGFLAERGADVPGTAAPETGRAEIYRWLSVHAEGRAAVIAPVPEGDQGVDLDVLVHARRGLVWGGPQYARAWGYPAAELERRRAVSRDLERGEFEPRHEATLETLRSAGASEFYYLESAPVPGNGGVRLGGRWSPVFENRSARLWRYGGGRPQVAGAPASETGVR